MSQSIRKLSFAVSSLLACMLLAGCTTSNRSSGLDDSLAGAKSHFAAFGTNRIHYLVAGKGTQTIVFVHCWAGRAEFWREQVPALSGKARLILIDLPGHGLSDKPRTDYTIDFFARSVLAVMRDAKVDKAILVGHSMGVPVICWVCRDAPKKVAALVAVDGFLRRPAMTREQSDEFLGPFRSPGYRQHTTEFIGSMFPIMGTEALRDRVLADIVQTPQYVMLGAMEGMFGPDEPDWDPHRVEVPVLVLNAKNPLWTAAYETYVRSLSSHVEYRMIDGMGHWLMLEKPTEFNATLLEMLQKYNLVEK